MTISDQLIQLNQAKQSIKTAIEAKGVSLANVPFTQFGNSIAQITGGATTTVLYNGWVRDPLWLPIPSYQPSEEVCYILLGVKQGVPVTINLTATATAPMPDSNNVRIEWGDGTSVDTTGTAQSKTYQYESLPASTVLANGKRQVLIKIYPTGSTGKLVNVNWPASGSITPAVLDFVFNGNHTAVNPNLHTKSASNLERILITGNCIVTGHGSQPTILPKLKVLSLPPSYFKNISTGFIVGIYRAASLVSGVYNDLTFDLTSVANVSYFSSKVNGKITLNNTQSATSFASAFADPYVTEVTCNTNAAANVNAMFNGAALIKKINLTSLSAVSDSTNFLGSNFSLEEFNATNINFSLSFANTQMSGTALNNVFANLVTQTTVGSKIITITNAEGAANCDRNIATLKLWTVTG